MIQSENFIINLKKNYDQHDNHGKFEQYVFYARHKKMQSGS